MGEVADMMIGGDLCEACGVALDGDGYGIPRYCSNECARDRGYDHRATDGAGAYRRRKTHGQRPNVFSLNMTYDGQAMFDDKKKLRFRNVSHDKAKELADKLREVAEQFDWESPSRDTAGGSS